MTPEPESNHGDETVICKVGLRDRRRRPAIPITGTRFRTSRLYSLDSIEGWVPVDRTRDVLSTGLWPGVGGTLTYPTEGPRHG